MQGDLGDCFLNGGNRTTIRVDNSTKMVFMANNQHTLTGDLTITGGDISSEKPICC